MLPVTHGLCLLPAYYPFFQGLIVYWQNHETCIYVLSCCYSQPPALQGHLFRQIEALLPPLSPFCHYAGLLCVMLSGIILPFHFFFPIYAQREDLADVIHVRGCIHAVNLWMGDNIGATVGICCAVGLPQVKYLYSVVYFTLVFHLFFAKFPEMQYG